ncbi:aminoglycoside N(3)-acetyltransferase [Alkalihalobacillus sp. AL-G]|uniref:aminoglycoside N(3)-acetyltransferase n=1 Tax=Alkalihalobacillus sp. AL-G TaxID=2926399 RepID=UPI00272D88B9|nr:AAC(3) family N-acetyltransferase [Alkalihalobacillus sp. AL-G]WLD94051.1 AAC(3) family N-acetyltransferase [Alkalihalobacillus sp. AL-G]
MYTKQLIQDTDYPRTRETLKEDLYSLGIKEGMTVIVHASLKSIGWVNGGAQTVIHALMDAVTEEGTLILQAHSAHLTDPEEWENPPIPDSWWETVRKTMPPFDPKTTPTYKIGQIPELFRTFPDVFRSNHPVMSVASWGKNAKAITQDHLLDYGFGDGSPLAKAYDLDASVLFIGTGFDTHTSLHLAETQSGVRKQVKKGAPILIKGQHVWKTYDEIEYDDEDFEAIGTAYKKVAEIKKGKIGSAHSMLFNQKDSVDFASDWLKENRNKD